MTSSHIPRFGHSASICCELFEPVIDYLLFFEDHELDLPIEYYELLFYCLPTDICEEFDCDYQSFYDYLMKKGDYYESEC